MRARLLSNQHELMFIKYVVLTEINFIFETNQMFNMVVGQNKFLDRYIIYKLSTIIPIMSKINCVLSMIFRSNCIYLDY